MLDRPPPTPSAWNKARNRGRNAAGIVVRRGWELVQRYGSVGPTTRLARRFGAFGEGSVICFPYETIVNEHAISIGSGSVLGKGLVLSAGWGPDQPGLPPDLVRIGDRCLIGRGSSIVGHESIVIGDDVWTGQQVHVTDMNHGYVDTEQPISRQAASPAPVVIGSGSWLGHGVVVLPGVTIGRNVVVGAGSVVARDLPDHCVAVGVPARPVRRFDAERGWLDVDASSGAEQPARHGVAALANQLAQLAQDQAAASREAEGLRRVAT